MNEALAKYIIAGHDIRDRNSYQKRGAGGHNRYKQASSQRRIVILLRKKPDVVFKGESGRLVGKEASGDQGAEGVDQKD